MKQTKQDITSLADVQLLVDSFYNKVQGNKLLGPIFEDRIANEWPRHLEKMYRFWQTILLDEHTYFGSPFPPHATMPIDKNHFDAWLCLFTQTVDEHFEGAKATEAKWRAEKMALMFTSKLNYYKNNAAQPLV